MRQHALISPEPTMHIQIRGAHVEIRNWSFAQRTRIQKFVAIVVHSMASCKRASTCIPTLWEGLGQVSQLSHFQKAELTADGQGISAKTKPSCPPLMGLHLISQDVASPAHPSMDIMEREMKTFSQPVPVSPDLVTASMKTKRPNAKLPPFVASPPSRVIVSLSGVTVDEQMPHAISTNLKKIIECVRSDVVVR